MYLQGIGNLPNADTEITLLQHYEIWITEIQEKRKKSNWENKYIIDETSGHNTKMVSAIFFCFVLGFFSHLFIQMSD